ncbi:aminobenzoyl-glutamate transporter [Aerococcus sp. HMSC035B07]|uniref:AbgT family transporter n=1 Tax=Aerococcus sp. HMSC035B07 TaxID=1715184 RepID=UPI0008A923EF|nr:AbgT family transporter [Aerococcus sp. HMSC035B07]OHO43946.1 aminobenzoyl-glutamate transporter [Aerococcus sp. HMSC035B07]
MEVEKKTPLQSFLDWVERVGNRLPHPVIIFIILSVIIMVLSAIFAELGASADYFDAKANEQVTVEAVSLLSGEGFRYIFNHATTNFTGFAPLGTVLVTMLGVGVAEWTGLIGAALKKLVTQVPDSLLTAVVVFAGVISNIASDAGYVVVIPLGAIVFAGAGRHPIAGLAAAFAGVSGGFSANLMFGPTDALLTGITNAALDSVGIEHTVSITGNWYFIMASTVVLTIVGTWVSTRIVEPHLGHYEGNAVHDDQALTPDENRGLKHAGIAMLVFLVISALAMVPEGAPLRSLNEATGQYDLQEFLNNGLIFYIFLLFAIPGLAYGRQTQKISSSDDFVAAMTASMKSMASYIVLAFFAAQLIAYFSYTNLGLLLANSGAEFLKTVGLTGIPLILAFILLTAFVNLFIGSASAKWAIMAPIFVPMFFQLGLSPELTQMAYRVADSSTNIISPLMSYFAMILVFMQRYDKKSGLGTLISVMLPYSIAFLVFWTLMLVAWYVFNLPLGPGAGLHI